MNRKTVVVDEIGTVEYGKSAKARHMRIAVGRETGVVVSVPMHISFEEAEKFLISKLKWIKKAQAKLNSEKREQTVYNAKDEFSTKFRTMNLLPEDRENLRLKIFEKHFNIYYPQNMDVENSDIQSVIRRFIEHVWKVEAHEYLPERLMYWANSFNFKYTSLTIKNTRSFWGKCDGHNAIVLSLHLMHLPDHLIDYVILHELCHTVHKNHQREFWQLLDRCTSSKAKSMAKEMKNYSTSVY
ncbi:MAG: M48 family metallopeptidase [Prevotellaceae bacterium]|jgi:predicted metal-dependent hydrolase|nr:M48 family metallopeptidase [Prevotellaceae bacterium]